MVIRDLFLTVRLVQMIEDVLGFRQHPISVRKDRDIVLTGDFFDHYAHRANVGHDDVLIFDMEVSQFSAHHVTVWTPGDVIESE